MTLAQTSNEVALHFDDVIKSFRSGKRTVVALDEVNARIAAGKITGLIGPDGAGKTTLMRLTAGLLRADSLCAELEHSLYFNAIYVHGMPAAKQAIMERRVDAILHLREDFSEQLRRPGGAPVQLVVNGVDANTARIVNGYVAGAYVEPFRPDRPHGT